MPSSSSTKIASLIQVVGRQEALILLYGVVIGTSLTNLPEFLFPIFGQLMDGINSEIWSQLNELLVLVFALSGMMVNWIFLMNIHRYDRSYTGKTAFFLEIFVVTLWGILAACAVSHQLIYATLIIALIWTLHTAWRLNYANLLKSKLRKKASTSFESKAEKSIRYHYRLALGNLCIAVTNLAFFFCTLYIKFNHTPKITFKISILMLLTSILLHFITELSRNRTLLKRLKNLTGQGKSRYRPLLGSNRRTMLSPTLADRRSTAGPAKSGNRSARWRSHRTPQAHTDR